MEFSKAFVQCKWAAALANFDHQVISEAQKSAIAQACAEIVAGAHADPLGVDLLEGSPPCSSFSTVGWRAGQFEDKRGKVKDYSEGIKQATDDLFEEWVRLVDGIRPKAIGLENQPQEPCVILSKHQWAWVTMTSTDFVPNGPPCFFALTKQLLIVPLIGRGLPPYKLLSMYRSL